MNYQFIEHHKREFPIVLMCNVLGVSESGFYAWRKRPTCQRQREDARLTEEIRQVFAGHQGRYGSPRIHRDLQDQGRSTSRNRVARLMREADVGARRKQRRVTTTRRDLSHAMAPTVLNREFTASEPNQKWVTDITCAGYIGYPFKKSTSSMALPVPFLGIIIPDWQERDFLLGCFFPNIGTDILCSQHRKEMIPIPNRINAQILGATVSIRVQLVGRVLLA